MFFWPVVEKQVFVNTYYTTKTQNVDVLRRFRSYDCTPQAKREIKATSLHFKVAKLEFG